MESVEDKDDDDDIEDMNKKLLRFDIEFDYNEKREIENFECVVYCVKEKKEERKISVWREVKRKFGCMIFLIVDVCNCYIKKRKKIYYYYK